ncbi:MAG: M28 family peptidase [Calditrichia bacterium]
MTFQTQLTEKKVDVKNVVGLLKGETDETVVVGAHYDHEGRRDEDIYNGADDSSLPAPPVAGTRGSLWQRREGRSAVCCLSRLPPRKKG